MEKDKKVVLVLEDEEPLLRAVTYSLEKAGFAVLAAKSAEEGRDHLNGPVQVSAIWLDHYLLGKEKGMGFLRSIKAQPEFSNLPILVVSNTADIGVVSKYMEIGIYKYYIKAEHRLEDIIIDLKASLNVN